MAPRRALTWVYRYRISIWVVVFTALTVAALASGAVAVRRIAGVQRDLHHEIAVNEADACLNSWERLDGSRVAIASSIEGVLTLAFAVSSPEDLTPDRRAEIEKAAAPIVADSQAKIPEPECDRDRARLRLAELQGAP